jgi:hypothetical protein
MEQATLDPEASRSRFELWTNVLGYLLLVLASPAFLENAYEVYVGTLLAGPQMIGYVLAHSSPDSVFVIVIRYSTVAYLVFTAYALAAVVRILRARPTDRHQQFFAWCFVTMSMHHLLLAGYGYWSPLFS